MAQRPTDRSQTLLIGALQNLSDGVTGLVGNHLALAQLELKQDAAAAARDIAAIVVAGVFALIGYLLLNVAAILFAAWHGLAAAAIVGGSLALVNLLGGGFALVGLGARARQRYYGYYTQTAIKRSTTWAKNEVTSAPTETATEERLEATVEPERPA
jgi:uncharacterized membrane protein YqjE